MFTLTNHPTKKNQKKSSLKNHHFLQPFPTFPTHLRWKDPPEGWLLSTPFIKRSAFSGPIILASQQNLTHTIIWCLKKTFDRPPTIEGNLMKYILKLNVSAVRIPLLNLPTFWGDRPTGGKGLALPGSSGPNLPWEVWNFHGPRCEVSWEKNTSPKLIWYPWSLTLQLANRERVGIFQPPLFFFFFGGGAVKLGRNIPPKTAPTRKKGGWWLFSRRNARYYLGRDEW